MKLPLRYLALGLEIWLGVSAIVMGLYLLVFSIAGMGMNVVPGDFQQFAGFVLATFGVILVVDAVRRELRVQVIETMERFGNPLDSPTQA
jgi:N-methylhydantoinase A/oxoprolinase/acetone carboxylase beta subunit